VAKGALMFERFNEQARQAVVHAQQEADALRHNYVGTEHLLLGLLDGESGAAHVLTSFGLAHDELVAGVKALIGEGRPADVDALASIGIDLDEVRRRVEAAFGRGALERTRAGRRLCGSRSFTPRSKKVLELAAKEARSLGHGWLGPEHLLLGLLAVEQGVATQLLVDAGVEPGRVREAVLARLGLAA
jgi:ATP-dependent Clp protease ATP-binding subunit ClpA